MLPKVKKVLDNYENPQTKVNMETAIIQFFKAIYNKVNSEDLEIIADKYFSEQRDYEEDVQNFLKTISSLAPLTIKLKVSNVKTFLLENDIELPQKFWRKIIRRIKGSRALTLDRIPTNKELKKLLLHLPIQGKALFQILESSGMRIGELLKSNIDDMYLNEKPARIQIRGNITKTGNSRHAFFSREAKDALTEWLKVREDYLEAAVAKSHIYDKKPEDLRIFPFDRTTAYHMWRKALHKSGLNGKDKSTGREKIHPHVLRKFFRTRLGAVIPVDVVEALMGQEGYLTEVYRRYSLEDLRQFYLEGEPALSVFTDTKEVIELQQRIEQKNKELQKEIEEKNTRLQVLVNSLAIENQNMKTRLEAVEKKDRETKDEMYKLSEKLNSVISKLENLEK